MCGIFGIISNDMVKFNEIKQLGNLSSRRGKDSSGIIYLKKDKYYVVKNDSNINDIFRQYKNLSSNIILGHTRLITNSIYDNQPVINDNIAVLHNGIILNHDEIALKNKFKRKYKIDSEILNSILIYNLTKNKNYNQIALDIKKKCKGIVSCAFLIPQIGEVFLYSNNGSLFTAEKNNSILFASEHSFLERLFCKNIKQVSLFKVLKVTKSNCKFNIIENKIKRPNILISLKENKNNERLIKHSKNNLKRCTKCILPETMPFIKFNESGVCNYCLNYKSRFKNQNKQDLHLTINKYRSKDSSECIIPFSGGRDSTFALHVAVKTLKLKTITYTYDWGMITDLARRNISLMCDQFGIENIVIADNIQYKRNNIKKNLIAWLKKPHLGMISLLTAGDKHFFKYINDVKKETKIKLNLWGTNPLETTHFKSGFLGLGPSFEEKQVYNSSYLKQITYQYLRIKEMVKNPSYFNSSIYDTLSGEYYRTISKKNDYYHIFDYINWNEIEINKTLDFYGWEKAPDTNCTWRIGDGTAAFYNYVYYTVTGFTEHDTFRSNQIREGLIDRKTALKLVNSENFPRYLNIKWYLDILQVDFKKVIQIINKIPKIYMS